MSDTITEIFHRIQKKYTVSQWMVAGGMGTIILSTFLSESNGRDALIFSGFMSYMIGVPRLGINSGKMCKLANPYDQKNKLVRNGWYLYWTGKGMQIAGISIISLDALRLSTMFFHGGKPNEQLLNVGAGLIAGGFFIDILTWYQFRKAYKKSEMSIINKAISLKLFEIKSDQVVPGIVYTVDY